VLPITSGWVGEVECEVVIDETNYDNESLPSPGASVLVTAADSAPVIRSGGNNTTNSSMAAMSLSNMSSAAVSEHPRPPKGKKAATAAPASGSGPGSIANNNEAVAAYVDMLRDKKRMQRLKEKVLYLF
jgi:hypothetical protein